MVWHYHDDDLRGPDAAVEITLKKFPAAKGIARLQHFRIDEDHSNAFAAWKKMGSPQTPTSEQYAALEKSGQLVQMNAGESVKWEDHTAKINFSLPRQGVSLLVLDLLNK
jgi:xylan 1,4-beta-xylosidase